MTSIEKEFDKALITNCEIAKQECGYNPTRFLQTIEKFGGVKTAKEILRKGRLSDGFEKLQEAGRIDLTMEATIVKSQFGALFTDDEVNTCYELLCEYGYYK